MFEYDDYTLSGEAEIKLDNFISVFKKSNGYYINVNGYTDNNGNPAYIKKLSANRIESVINYLLAGGVDRKSISSKNIGSTDDFSNSGDTEISMKLNRRVELSMNNTRDDPLAKSDIKHSKKNTDNKNTILTMDTKFIIRHELKKIASDKITFEVPVEIKENESGNVKVVIDDDLITTLSQKLKNNTYKLFEKINSIELNRLDLSANDMDITTIKKNDSGKWVWSITPVESGLHTVSLVISLKFSTSNGAQDVISLPIMLKAVSVPEKPSYIVSGPYRKGLFIIFIVIVALGIFKLINKRMRKETSRDNRIA